MAFGKLKKKISTIPTQLSILLKVYLLDLRSIFNEAPTQRIFKSNFAFGFNLMK